MRTLDEAWAVRDELIAELGLVNQQREQLHLQIRSWTQSLATLGIRCPREEWNKIQQQWSNTGLRVQQLCRKLSAIKAEIRPLEQQQKISFTDYFREAAREMLTRDVFDEICQEAARMRDAAVAAAK